VIQRIPVRQLFFCGGDEFEEWKKGLNDLTEAKTKKTAEQTLKVEIDDEAFNRLYGHKSQPFPVTRGQKVAVRVISQSGEEMTKMVGVEEP
jgi:adenine-specific DNA-methyltransferase